MGPTRSDHGSSTPPPANDLQGWKDIAAYLGKSVRAAQRWEQDLGLPVHRLKTAAGQSIFARRDEIDRWRAQQEILPAGNPDEGDEEAAPGPRGWLSRPALFGGLAACALGIAVIAALASRSNASPPAPATYRFVDNALVAENASGGVLWQHAFDKPIVTVRPVGQGSTPVPAERVHSVDLDDDGVAEVLAVVTYKHGDTMEGDELYCFSNTGAVRWVYRPGFTLPFRAGPFSPPWLITAVAVARGGPPAIYVAASHHLWWPSVVVRVGAGGVGETRFVHSGHIYAMGFWTIAGMRHLVAGGINNEYAAGAIAVMPDGGPPARSPQTPGSKYECHGCPAALPLRYFVFSPTEVSVAADAPYNRVVSLMVVADALHAQIDEAPLVPGAATVFRIGENLELLEASAGDGYWNAHRRLESTGRLHHRHTDCQKHSTGIRTFDPERGWRAASVTFTGAVPGSAR